MPDAQWCEACKGRHPLCPGCDAPVAHSSGWRRYFDAHGNGPHVCASAEWAREQVDEGYLLMREPMTKPPVQAPSAATSRPEPPTRRPAPERLLRRIDA